MCLNPLSGSLNLATMGTGGCSWPGPWAPWPCLAEAVGPSETDRDRGGVNDKWDEDHWVRKGGGEKREEVACGSVIECRSGLSWWGGEDDKVEWRARVSGEDYKAFGSLVPPAGWPQALHISCFLILVRLISIPVVASVIPQHKAYQGLRLFKCSLHRPGSGLKTCPYPFAVLHFVTLRPHA